MVSFTGKKDQSQDWLMRYGGMMDVWLKDISMRRIEITVGNDAVVIESDKTL